MWQKKEAGIMNWQDARSYNGRLELAGYKDWRLPSKEALESAYKIKDRFPTYHPSNYWACHDSVEQWHGRRFNFILDDNNGYDDFNSSDYRYVLCVRRGTGIVYIHRLAKAWPYRW